MYRCYNLKRFFRLLLLDAVIFSICCCFALIGKSILYASGKKMEERIFLPVIMYHSIYGNEPEEYIVTPEQLERDLSYLSEHNYHAISAYQLIDYVYKGINLPENPVLITLDDGFYNNLSILVPLLEKYDMNAVVSIVGSYTDNNAAADSHVDAYSYLTWEDISGLAATGRVEIGNHTYNMHSYSAARKGCSKNPGESADEYMKILEDDITLLQSEFQEHTGMMPYIFTYPYGMISPESIPVLKENGFLITMNCCEHPNYITREPECLYGLNRFNRSGLYSTEEFMEMLLKEN